MSTQQHTGLVVSRTAVVPATPERAFEVFTQEIATWWPLDSHSVEGVGKDESGRRTVVFEGRQDGRVYEVMTNGDEAHWAKVITWEPPDRFVLEWKVNPDAIAPTEVEVRFAREGDGTRVELEHRGFERLGDAAESTHENYSGGWPTVLQKFVDNLSK